MGAPYGLSGGAVAGRSFEALFALAGSDSMDADSLGRRLGLAKGDCERLVAALQRAYLVDAVSLLEGSAVKESLRLTEEGEAALLRSLERMCELPEAIGT